MNYTQPLLVTLTGVDDNTDLKELHDLSEEFPGMVEWGILMSPKKAGEPRYPTLKTISKLIDIPIRFSIHLCGDYSRQVNTLGQCKDFEAVANNHVKRVQINSKEYTFPYCAYFRKNINQTVILQWRSLEWPTDDCYQQFDLLYDCSGGTGKVAKKWPKQQKSNFVGYAGGIGPDNVAEIVKTLRKQTKPGNWWWIDMETKLRNSENSFSLKKCQQVLKTVRAMVQEKAV